MKIAIFGAGAVGGYFGGRLAQSGEEVIFIARGKHLQAMKNDGLKVDSINGDFIVQPVRATDNPEEVGVVDMVLVAVKAWQVPDAATAIKPMVGPDTFVLPLQNGVEAPAQLAAVLGRQHVLGGLCGLITYIVEPGHICHAGTDPFIRFGELDNRQSDRTELLKDVFERAPGITANIPSDINAAMWQKFLLIAAWSGLGAITRAPIGIFRSQPGTRQMLEQILIEICAVAQARDIGLPDDVVAKTLELLDALPAAGTASMQRDILDGKPSELENQTGAVVRLGQEAGVETPVNKFIYNCLLPMEMRARGQLNF
ncbi:MAG: 2-dehydropantoate 2-reductase [Desulfobacterales bacterium]